MKTIELTQGKVAIVDDCDFDLLNSFKWHAVKIGTTGHFYACRDVNDKHIKMHNVVAAFCFGDIPKGLLVDHKNRDTLDNSRANLRLATRSQNQWNSRKRAGSSKYKGISFSKTRNKWRARLMINYKEIYIGEFGTEELAHEAYKVAAIKHFGEFACFDGLDK